MDKYYMFIASERLVSRLKMIIRLNGGQCVQVIQQYDRVAEQTKYRARLSDTQGRSQSEFTEWFTNFDEAVEAAKEMPKTARGKLNNSQ